jgi:hypothetical protein
VIFERIDEDAKDERIDAALRVLAHTSPPIGLEERVQARVRAHRRDLVTQRPANRRYVGWAAISLATAAALALLVMEHRNPLPAARTESATLAVTGVPSNPPKVSHFDAAPAPEMAVRPPHAARARLQTALPRGPEKLETGKLQEASFPAPPAPLTREEKLLLEMARRNNSAAQPEVAALTVSEVVKGHGLAADTTFAPLATPSE